MNIVILTSNESLYLPSFFAYLFRERNDIVAVFCTPPGHGKKNSLWNMARKYRRAFGTLNLARLGLLMLHHKMMDAIKPLSGNFGHSVQSVCTTQGVHCESVANVNHPAFLERLRMLKTDLIVSVSCPQIFKKPLIDLAPKGCLNIHGSPLPNYRGLLPSFWMMAKGETSAAVTVFTVNEKIDAGSVVVTEHFAIKPNESLHEFILRSRPYHCRALLKAIQMIEQNEAEYRPLNTEAGSYFGFPNREDYLEFRNRGRRLW